MNEDNKYTVGGEEFSTTSTGAQRESIGTKINTDLVPFELIISAAVGLGLGEHKYTARNFEKGLSYKSLINSIERHCKALKDGEEFDTDTGIPHHMLIASSTAMLNHNIIQGVIIDDRAPPKRSNYDIAQLAVMGQLFLNDAIKLWKDKKNVKDDKQENSSCVSREAGKPHY